MIARLAALLLLAATVALAKVAIQNYAQARLNYAVSATLAAYLVGYTAVLWLKEDI